MGYTRPDVYLLRKTSGAPSVAVGASTFGLIGLAKRGAVGKPVLVQSFAEFERKYGGIVAESLMGYQARGFFDNGGKDLYVVRVAKNATKASYVLKDASNNTIGTFYGSTEGTWAQGVKITVSNIVGNAFDITLSLDGIDEKHSVTHADKLLVEFENNELVNFVPTDTTKIPVAITAVAMTGGDNGYTGILDTDFVTGLSAFDAVSVDMLATSVVKTITQKGVSDYCDTRKDCQAIISAPLNGTSTSDETYLTTLAVQTPFAQVYAPAVKVINPATGGTVVVPNEGHIAGYIASNDAERGVQKAPAGEGRALKGIVGLLYEPTVLEQGKFNNKNVNALCKLGNAFVVWGARTCDTVGKFKYVNTQRSMNYVGKDLMANTKWSVFENNDPATDRAVTNAIRGRLTTLMKAGMFAGKSEEECFYVICDDSNNTQSTRDQGERYVDVGVALQKPSEFLVLRLSNMN